MRATQHTAAFWDNRFIDAARYAEDGLRYAATGSAEASLASAEALDLAKAGRPHEARAALARARDATEAVEQAYDERVLTAWRNLGSERMARVQQVRAHLALSQLDGGPYEALAPVLDMAPEYRVHPLAQRLDEVHTQAATCNEPMLCVMREAITVFREQTVVGELTS